MIPGRTLPVVFVIGSERSRCGCGWVTCARVVRARMICVTRPRGACEPAKRARREPKLLC
eukprot:5793-Pelagococcus_subviridis.AAC.2